MSHNRRHIIIESIKPAFEDSEVRDALTATQRIRVDEILASADPSDEDFRYLLRRMSQAYCADD